MQLDEQRKYLLTSFIHFIQTISVAPLQVHYYSQALILSYWLFACFHSNFFGYLQLPTSLNKLIILQFTHVSS